MTTKRQNRGGVTVGHLQAFTAHVGNPKTVFE